MGISGVIAALETNIKDAGRDQALPDRPAPDVSPGVELTADTVSKYLHGISANSCNEIDALISSLRGLRDRLNLDGGRLEQGVAEFANLNQSVVKLTEVVSNSVAHVQTPSFVDQ